MGLRCKKLKSLAKAWVSAETAASEVGTWRETKPGFSPSPPSASIQHAPQGRRILILIIIIIILLIINTITFPPLK